MREDGPVRKDLGPDGAAAEAAAPYIGTGRVMLGRLKNLMKLGGLSQLTRTAYLEDGTAITVSSVFGQDTIRITPATSTPVPTQTPTEQQEETFPDLALTFPDGILLAVFAGSVNIGTGNAYAEFGPGTIKTTYKLGVDPATGQPADTTTDKIPYLLPVALAPQYLNSANGLLAGLVDANTMQPLPLSYQPTELTLTSPDYVIIGGFGLSTTPAQQMIDGGNITDPKNLGEILFANLAFKDVVYTLKAKGPGGVASGQIRSPANIAFAALYPTYRINVLGTNYDSVATINGVPLPFGDLQVVPIGLGVDYVCTLSVPASYAGGITVELEPWLTIANPPDGLSPAPIITSVNNTHANSIFVGPYNSNEVARIAGMDSWTQTGGNLAMGPATGYWGRDLQGSISTPGTYTATGTMNTSDQFGHIQGIPVNITFHYIAI